MGRRRSSWEPSVVAFDRWTVVAVAIASTVIFVTGFAAGVVLRLSW